MKGPIAIGTVGHMALERYFRERMDDTPHNQAVKAANSEFTSVLNLGDKSPFDLEAVMKAYTCVERYFAYYGSHDNWKFMKVEESLEMPFPKRDFSIPMKLDLLVFDKDTGTVRLVDHKFTYDWWRERKFNLRGQFPKYIAILRYNEIEVHGAIINQLRYREMKSKKLEDYNKRSYYTVSNTKIQRVLRDHMQTSEWIMNFRNLSPEEQEKKAKYLLVDPICKGCAFADLCETELEGGYIDTMLQTDYKKNDYGYNEDDELEFTLENL